MYLYRYLIRSSWNQNECDFEIKLNRSIYSGFETKKKKY